MLTVFIPNNFIPERTYAVNVLLQHYLKTEVNIIPRKVQIDYQLSWENKSIIIRDQFFGKTFVGETYLQPDRIPEKIFETTAPEFEKIIAIYGDDKLEINEDQILSDVDLFAGAFFMLTRWEESLSLVEDLHGRFPADQSVVVKSGFILRPIVDEYVALIRSWLSHLGYPLQVSTSKFTVVPTCDVDIPYYSRSKPSWKLLGGRFLQHRSFKELKEDYRTLKAMRSDLQKDPFDTFDFLMTSAEEKQLRFLFHLIGGGETKFEGYYSISDPHIISLMENFQRRGHLIGLHPSYNAFNDPRKLDKERFAVEKFSGQTIKASRQHYLRFAVPATWNHLQNAYIESDSTLGYAAEPGFRCGTSNPFPVFDVHQQIELPLIERPLLIMDVSLRFYKGFTIDESIIYCEKIITEVKKHKGELVFLWHNSTLSEQDGWKGWDRVFKFMIGA